MSHCGLSDPRKKIKLVRGAPLTRCNGCDNVAALAEQSLEEKRDVLRPRNDTCMP